jgi:hypothetical protein
MRVILISIVGGCLLCLAGCGGSERVEMPKNPTPPPKDAVPMTAGAGGSRASVPAPVKGAHPPGVPKRTQQ